jgi:hypothetical protein
VNAGTAIDTLLADPNYASKSKIVLVYNVSLNNARKSLWWQSYKAINPTATSAYFPWVMVDSGKRINYGTSTTSYDEVNYYDSLFGVEITKTVTLLDVFKDMVDNTIYRSPQAVITATYQINGNVVTYDMTVKNKSSVTLSYSSNQASLYGIVFEDKTPGVITANVHDVATYQLTSLASNSAGTFTFQSASLSGFNLNQMKYLVILDYLPTGSSGAHDMLASVQATKK